MTVLSHIVIIINSLSLPLSSYLLFKTAYGLKTGPRQWGHLYPPSSDMSMHIFVIFEKNSIFSIVTPLIKKNTLYILEEKFFLSFIFFCSIVCLSNVEKIVNGRLNGTNRKLFSTRSEVRY